MSLLIFSEDIRGGYYNMPYAKISIKVLEMVVPTT